jgi:hypothetical protein
LHDIDISRVYNELIKYANASSDKELLYSYIEGLFLHYSLDRECHPYIFAKAGYAKDGPKKKHYSPPRIAASKVTSTSCWGKPTGPSPIGPINS